MSMRMKPVHDINVLGLARVILRLIADLTTGRSCVVASHTGAKLWASNLSVDRQSRNPTSSFPSRPLFASIPTKLTFDAVVLFPRNAG
jgi:hypothetical protein